MKQTVTNAATGYVHIIPESYPANIVNLIEEFESDVLWLHHGDMNDVETQLMTSQYAYVKFGLILERIRNECFWKRCVEKFSDFRQFCQKKVNMNIWQITNAIKSARVAVTLISRGFNQLPRNASQALKLADLPVERLEEVWGNVVKSCEGHKITASAIESQIHPDKEVTSSTLRLPAAVVDGLTRQAIERGLTLQEYLRQLPDGEDLDEGAIDPNPHPVDPAMSEVIDNLDRKFKSIAPKQMIDNVVDRTVVGVASRIENRFDELMDDLIGQFILPVRRVANE